MKNNQENEVYIDDSVKMYLKECSQYPLLKQSEEIYYATIISKSKDSRLLNCSECDGYRVYSLNIEQLFCSLCNNKDYMIIIDSLIECYSNLYSTSKDLTLLTKYQKESTKLNRSLNQEELKQLFNIDYEKISPIENGDLPSEIKKVIDYKTASYKMFVSNLLLVCSIAFGFGSYIKKNDVFGILDLISEGNNGLAKAIDNYDVTLGFRFSTYATRCIEDTMKRAISKYKPLIRIPEHYRSSMRAFNRQVIELEKEAGRTLSAKEIAESLGIPVEMVREFQRNMQSPVYLDKPVGEDGESTFKDFISSPDDIDDMVTKQFLNEDIEALYRLLNEREVMVLKMYFGIGTKKLSLTEIGQIMHLSPQGAERIKSKALSKLRVFARRVPDLKSLGEYTR